MTNLFRVRKFPKILFTYETDFTKKETLYKSVPENTLIPECIIYNQILYTLVEPRNQSEYFKTHIVKPETEKTIHFKM